MLSAKCLITRTALVKGSKSRLLDKCFLEETPPLIYASDMKTSIKHTHSHVPLLWASIFNCFTFTVHKLTDTSPRNTVIDFSYKRRGISSCT